MEFLQRLHPAQETLTEIGGHVSAAQKLLERGDGPRKVLPHPQDNLQIILDTPSTSMAAAVMVVERKSVLQVSMAVLKLSGGHSQAYPVPQGELCQRQRREEALAEIKGLGMRKARVTGKALRRQRMHSFSSTGVCTGAVSRLSDSMSDEGTQCPSVPTALPPVCRCCVAVAASATVGTHFAISH